MSGWFQQPMIAYDHSKCCQIALEIFLSLKDKYSKSHILNVFNSNKSGYIPLSQSYNTISQYLKSKYPPQSKQNSTIQLRQQGNKTINQVILESFISSGTNLLFLGFVGSKGKKPRSKDFSSRIRQFVYQSKFNLAIIKRQNSSTSTDNVLYCFDGSQIALQGLKKANQFCLEYNKKLHVIYCYNSLLSTQVKHIKNMIKSIKSNQKQLKFDFICEEADLIQWIKQKQSQYQWVIVTSNGYRGSVSGKRFVGQNTTKILQEVNINMFLLRF